MRYILGIDQGTTSSRAVIFNDQGSIVGSAQQEFKQVYPQDGWVEHNPEDIWNSVFSTCQRVIKETGIDVKQIAGIGISNQRETTVLWDRTTGKPIYNAIVWQDRRTAAFCAEKKSDETMIQYKTGLLLDPYFSATKIAWILDHVEDAREKANAGQLAFGTIDSFILWRLTEGYSHKTDATNAARTLIFNIRTQIWDDELLKFFNIPKNLLPEVLDNSADFGVTHLFGHDIPITGMAGDQQAALIGQACFSEGMVKSTYGTGCFVVMNTGDKLIQSKNRLISTVAYRLKGETTYAIEGSIFVAGASIKWLRDTLHLITDTKQTAELARQANPHSGVYLVPAFTGLGAPYWDPNVRGAILGLTRDSGIAEIVRAALEAVCYQTKDLIDLFGIKISTLRVDGGMVVNDWMVQFLSDILNVSVERPMISETSVLGAAYLAGLHVGIFNSLEDISKLWALQKEFKPMMNDTQRQYFYSGWVEAVRKCLR